MRQRSDAVGGQQECRGACATSSTAPWVHGRRAARVQARPAVALLLSEPLETHAASTASAKPKPLPVAISHVPEEIEASG